MVNHYEVLGLPRTASAADIRAAYRKIAGQHHPDRSKDPKSAERFKRATESFEVLGDAERRKSYDLDLGIQLRKQAEAKRRANPFGPEAVATATPQPPTAKPKPRPTATTVNEDVARLTVLYSKGRYPETESLANQILERDGRQPIPYAVLGDLARLAGRTKEAIKMYAFAIQMDPKNELYQGRYEEILKQVAPADQPRETPGEQIDREKRIVAIVLLVVVACAIEVILHAGRPLMPRSIVSSWNADILIGLAVSGFAAGAGLSTAKWVDRLNSILATSLGRPSALGAYSLIALLNFWVATAIYAAIGLARGGFSYSTSRIFGAVALVVILLTVGTVMSPVDPIQTLFWGGNVVYLGALFGWLFTDAVRTR